MITDARHETEFLSIRRRSQSLQVLGQARVITGAEHTVRLAAAGMAVSEARAIEALSRRIETTTRSSRKSVASAERKRSRRT